MVPENSTFFCSTTATWLRRVSRSYLRTSTPPTFTLPSVTSYRRGISWIRLDLEEPVPPRMPMTSPDLMCRSMSDRALRSAFLEYLKLTWSKSTLPSRTSVRAPAGLVRVLSSLSTSTIRSADSCDMVIMVKTMDSIIRLIRIWKL